MSDKHLTLVPKKKDQDIDHLKEVMIEGMFDLQAALFSQASYENQRLIKTREHLELLENQIFTSEMFQLLDPIQKVQMHSLLNRNMNTSLLFLQNLHNNLTAGVDVVKQLEKEKTAAQIPKGEPDTDGKLDKVKELILAKLKEKLK